MNLSISIDDLKMYVARQLNNAFPDPHMVKASDLDGTLELAVERLDFSFDKVSYHKYKNNGQTIFDHLYSDQYLMFLWFLSNSVWKETANNRLASKIYYLNKSMHAFDCMYDTELPDIFFISHGIGTMLGKAKYGNFFIAMQGCTVGTNHKEYPVFGKGVSITAHSSVIGNCHIGNLVTVSANTSVFKRDIPDNSVVFESGETGLVTVKSSDFHFVHKVFDMSFFDSF